MSICLFIAYGCFLKTADMSNFDRDSKYFCLSQPLSPIFGSQPGVIGDNRLPPREAQALEVSTALI